MRHSLKPFAVMMSFVLLLTGCRASNEPTPLEVIDQAIEAASRATAITQNAVLLEQDTDGDGYPDIAEILVGSNPYKKEKFGKTHSVEYTFTDDEVSLKLRGTPNIVNTYTGVYESAAIKNRFLMLSPVYELYNPDFKKDIFEAELSITYNGDPDDDVAIYQYLDDGTLEILPSSTVSGNVVTAKLQHFSKYTVARRVLEDISEYVDRAFALCIDDSASMFTRLDRDTLIIGNDPGSLRWEFVKTFVDKYSNDEIYCNHYALTPVPLVLPSMSNSESFAAVAQHASYVNELAALLPEISKGPEKLVPDAKVLFDGTNTAGAAVDAIKSLAEIKARNRYLLMLTDGGDTTKRDRSEFMSLMKSSDIIPICVVLGTDVSMESIELYSSYNNGAIIYMNSADVFGQLDAILSNLIDGKDSEVSKRISTAFGKDIQVETLSDSGYRKEKDSLPFLNTDYMSIDSSLPNGGLCFGYAYTEQERYLTGSFYTNKREFSPNIVTSMFSSSTPLTCPAVKPKYLTAENYADVLHRLRTIISVYKDPLAIDRGYASYIKEDNTVVFVPSSADSELVKNFFIQHSESAPLGNKFFDASGNRFDTIKYYYPVYNRCLRAVQMDFRQYPELSVLDKACVEWLVLLIYNFNIQADSITLRSLGASCYTDTTTLGGLLQEAISEQLKTGDGGIYFKKRSEYFTALLSIYNHHHAGIPAILGFQCGSGGHEVLCSRMFRDTDNPTIIYLEIDDSNFYEPQYIQIKFGAMLVNCANRLGEEYMTEKLNLECPYAVTYSKPYGGSTVLNYIVVGVDMEKLKKYSKDL